MKYVENDKEQIKSAVHNGVLDGERMDEEKELEREKKLFDKLDKKRHERFIKEQQKEKEKFIFVINEILTDNGVSMHQIVYDEVGENGMVKLSVRDLINKASEIKEKRETVSRIILNAQYCKKDIVMELRAYCRRPDIGRWLRNQA